MHMLVIKTFLRGAPGVSSNIPSYAKLLMYVPIIERLRYPAPILYIHYNHCKCDDDDTFM